MGKRDVGASLLVLLLGLLRTDAGTERYVSLSGGDAPPYTNWATAARSIQAAVNACSNGDTVWVTNGTYTLTNHVTLIKGVLVAGVGGAAHTYIDGGGVSRGFLLSHSNAIVQGFCIINCRGTVPQGNGNAGGILIETNGMVRDCVIRNCFGKSGGGAYLKVGGTLRNCLIVSNAAGSTGYGGGVMCQEGGIIENCTIVGNSAVLGSSGVRSGVRIVNSIIYDNIGGDNIGGPLGSISYSCFTPYISGTGNTTNTPRLDLGFRPSAESPCVNKGTNLSWMVASSDLLGNARIAHGTVDMGAYERPGPRGLAVSVCLRGKPGQPMALGPN